MALSIRKGESYTVRVHTLVLIAFHGPPGEGMEGRHLDGDRTNNRADNLCWSDHLTNMRDKAAHGTVARGERQGSAKLTAEQVAEIRAARAAGRTLFSIADEYGVVFQTVSKIVNRKSWVEV